MYSWGGRIEQQRLAEQQRAAEQQLAAEMLDALEMDKIAGGQNCEWTYGVCGGTVFMEAQFL
jgi:hypothetical protein